MSTSPDCIIVSVSTGLPVDKAWELWTNPYHIMHWNQASSDWHTSFAENEPVAGGRFLSRMEARDGSVGFDFEGVYDRVVPFRELAYSLEDGRKVSVVFENEGPGSRITETFDPENINSRELQKEGWQAILDNFRRYAESRAALDYLHFESHIVAEPRNVFNLMISRDSYEKWTSVCSPSSRFEGEWKKRSKIVFLGTDKDGKTGGMTGSIKEFIAGRFISIEYSGIIKDGKEMTDGEEAGPWAGLQENYTFLPQGRGTLLSVDFSTTPDFTAYFRTTWPLALERLKSICEDNSFSGS